jgi:adenosine deaminase
MSHHQIGALLDAGICATVNSDDPAYFGGYMNDNFIATFEGLPTLGVSQAHALASNSFAASFVGPARKREWQSELDALFERP